jgi:hypothetical protein
LPIARQIINFKQYPIVEPAHATLRACSIPPTSSWQAFCLAKQASIRYTASQDALLQTVQQFCLS